jgi:uncharacterized protein with HEPN domain
MPVDPRLYLADLLRAGAALEEFTRGKDYSDYQGSLLLRSAVERQLEIVGEALNQLLIHAPQLEGRFQYRRQIKGFRNVLAHEYMAVDNLIVWGILEQFLPRLMAEAGEVLAELNSTAS